MRGTAVKPVFSNLRLYIFSLVVRKVEGEWILCLMSGSEAFLCLIAEC